MPKIYRLLSNVAFLFAKSQIVKTPNDNLLILDNNKSLHFDCQIKLFFFSIVAAATIPCMHVM